MCRVRVVGVGVGVFLVLLVQVVLSCYVVLAILCPGCHACSLGRLLGGFTLLFILSAVEAVSILLVVWRVLFLVVFRGVFPILCTVCICYALPCVGVGAYR